ncbi:MAG: 50S ribosomal protein L11 methyltransferase [Acidobacteriota bacterium]
MSRKLYVYECEGAPCSCANEPEGEGFLGLWPEPPYYYLFFDRPADGAVNQWLASREGWSLRDTYFIDYDQWQQEAREVHRVGPFLIGSAVDDPGPGEISLRIDPGVVFGSGLHPSTRGCLLTIADLFERERIERVVDLGTGTGILSLACARLGARRVLALDCNPLAVRTARANVRATGFEDRIALVVAGGLGVFREPSDLLLMNIEWPCMLSAIQEGFWSGYRFVVLSGFLEAQWEELARRLAPHGFEAVSRIALDGWLTATVVRR